MGEDRAKGKEGIEGVARADFEEDAAVVAGASASAGAIVLVEAEGSKEGILGGCGRQCRILHLEEKSLEQILVDNRKLISLDREGQCDCRKEEASVSCRIAKNLVEENRLGRLRCCREKRTIACRDGSSRLVEQESTILRWDRSCRH